MSPPFVNVLWPSGAPPSGFPNPVGRTSGGTSALTANPPLDLSALPRTEGNVMVLVFRSESATHTGPSGWTSEGSLKYTATNDQLSVWSKVVGASEASSQAFVQSGSDRCGWACIEFEAAHGDVSATLTEGLDPASHSPAWGSDDTAWVTACSVSASDNTLTAPSGYTNQVDGASAASTADTRSRAAIADKQATASSDNPGAWGASGTYYRAVSATIAVRPAP